MAKKATSKRRTTAKAGTPKPARGASRCKPEKSTKPGNDGEPLVVFAFRLTRAERDLIHEAAGPARASRMVKAVALAAAKADAEAFRQIVAEAKAAAK